MPSNSKENSSKDTYKIPKKSQKTVDEPKKAKHPLKDSHHREKIHSPFDGQVYLKQNLFGSNEATTSVKNREVITLNETFVLPAPPTPPILSMVPKKIQQNEDKISETTSGEFFQELFSLRKTYEKQLNIHREEIKELKKRVAVLEAAILKQGVVSNQEGSPMMIEDDEEDNSTEVLESREDAEDSKKIKEKSSVGESKIVVKERLKHCPLCDMDNHTLANCNRYKNTRNKYYEMQKSGLCTKCGDEDCEECPFDSIPCYICKGLQDVRFTHHMPELCFYHDKKALRKISRTRQSLSSHLSMESSEMSEPQQMPVQTQFVQGFGYPQYVLPQAATIPFQQHPNQAQVYLPQNQYPYPLMYQPMYPYQQPPSQ